MNFDPEDVRDMERTFGPVRSQMALPPERQLYRAIMKRDLDAVEEILPAVDLSKAERRGLTTVGSHALALAYRGRGEDIIRSLHEAGAQPGWSALMWAKLRHPELYPALVSTVGKKMIEREAKDHQLTYVALMTDDPIGLDNLLTQYPLASLDRPRGYGGPDEVTLMQRLSPDVLRVLLKHQAILPTTLLDRAIRKGRTDLVRVLLEGPAWRSLVLGNPRAIQLAQANDDMPMIRVLLAARASPTGLDSDRLIDLTDSMVDWVEVRRRADLPRLRALSSDHAAIIDWALNQESIWTTALMAATGPNLTRYIGRAI